MISFIIVNFHGFNDTVLCVKSIYSTLKSDFEVIVVDNSNSSLDFIKLTNYYNSDYQIFVYKIPNLGFGDACNYGVKKSRGDILFFLNNDTKINYFNGLSNLSNLVIKHNYIITPTVLNSDGSIQKNVGGFFSIFSSIIYFLQLPPGLKNNAIIQNFAKILFKRDRTLQQYLNTDISNVVPIDWVSGCALIISLENFNKIGGFDNNYFMYFEDQDFCNSHHKMGNTCLLFDEINLTHFIGGSQSGSNYKMELIKLKSLIYYSEKNIINGYILKYLIFVVCLFLLWFNKRIKFLFLNYFFR
jgi:GT2 family glycosyltransferase